MSLMVLSFSASGHGSQFLSMFSIRQQQMPDVGGFNYPQLWLQSNILLLTCSEFATALYHAWIAHLDIPLSHNKNVKYSFDGWASLWCLVGIMLKHFWKRDDVKRLLYPTVLNYFYGKLVKCLVGSSNLILHNAQILLLW